VLVNAFVGAMAGMERSILPAIAEQEFRLAAHTAILAFIAVFGIAPGRCRIASGAKASSRARVPPPWAPTGCGAT
jgi:hypothetical protein